MTDEKPLRNDPVRIGRDSQVRRGKGEATPSAEAPPAQDALSKAVAHHTAGRFKKAGALYRKILQNSPENSQALMLAGSLSLQTGDYQGAVSLLEEAVRCSPPDAGLRERLAAAYNGLGATRLAQGDSDGAADAFRQAISNHPTSVQAYNNMGSLLKQSGRIDEAIDCYRQALAVSPEAAVIHNNLGNALFARGEIGQAIQAYEKALRIDPAYARAYFNLGTSLSRMGKKAEAVEQFLSAIEQGPQFFEAHYNLGTLYHEMGQQTNATTAFQKAIAVRPDSAQAHCGLGISLHAAGCYPDAVRAFRQAVRRYPEYDEAHYCMGLSYHMDGRIDDAVSCYRRALDLRPDHIKALYALGNAQADNGRLEAAVQCYDQVIARHGHFQDVYNQLAETHRKLGNIPEAVRYFHAALAADPNDLAAEYMLAALEGKNPPAAPPALVEKIFDDYAERFDRHLTKKLAYQTPVLLKRTLNASCGGQMHFDNALDIGCGTGLAGEAFRSMCTNLTGVDISAKMIEKARRKKLYDHLRTGDFLQMDEAGQRAYDLIIAADVFVYIGDLDSTFRHCAAICLSGGYFVFSTEHRSSGAFLLRETGRYAHSRAYVATLADQNGFDIQAVRSVQLRKEEGHWVDGDVFILKRRR